ncbi:MAG: hypothetical protein DBX91_11150 [Subdoligranulum variabile]|nr:MAG: hypothetical protein DBX91_11150 [Subdoligranulum variabile]
MKERAYRKIWVIPLLLFFLCGSAAQTQPDDNHEERVHSAYVVKEEYDPMDFPTPPKCFSVNAQGQVAVGYLQAGRSYFSLIDEGRVVRTYFVDNIEGIFYIQLSGDTLAIYPGRASREEYLDLKTGIIRDGHLSKVEKDSICTELKSQNEITCGSYKLVSQVVKGHYQLQLNGETVLQCSVLRTYIRQIFFIGYAVVLLSIVLPGLYKNFVRQTPKPPDDIP